MNKRIRQLRKEQKPTQKELAKDTGIDQALLSKYETGERMPNTDKLIILADYYDVSIDYILSRTDNRNINRLETVKTQTGG